MEQKIQPPMKKISFWKWFELVKMIRHMTAREKFHLRERVRATRLFPKSFRKYSMSGKVVGFVKDAALVRVLRDGCTNADLWHIDFWESEPYVITEKEPMKGMRR